MKDYNWKDIASKLGRSDRWLRDWRITNQYVDPRPELTDIELDQQLRILSHNHPQRGEVMMKGYLNNANINVTRKLLRDSINRVDPEGRQHRKKKAVKRRVHPNELWHIDGNHKLRRYNLTIHGCIDGFSRRIIYLKCCDNNKATTVYYFFLLKYFIRKNFLINININYFKLIIYN